MQHRHSTAPVRGGRRPLALALAGWLVATPAAAIDFEFEDLGLTGSLRAQLAVGAALRTESRNTALVGKTNLPGQYNFCEDAPPGQPAVGTNCTTVAGNAAFLALPGYAGVNNDNGNLNYDKGDLVNSAVKVAPRLQLNYGEWGLDLSAIYFYDAANTGFSEFHPNNLPDNNGFQLRETDRPDITERDVGTDFRLQNAYLSGTLPLPGERQLSVKIGNQVLSLGTTTFLVFNGLNNINPPDANLRFMPTWDVRDIFVRVPLAVLGTNLTQNLAVQGIYQFGWEPVVAPPVGSFYSVNDIVGDGGTYAMALFGKAREDPLNLMGVAERTPGNSDLLSDSGRTLFRGPDRLPGDGGQYGASFDYFAEWLNNTTFGLTYLNLHSRFPTVNFTATDKSCDHDATNQAELVAACEGFKTDANMHGGQEFLPIDTSSVFLEYPENIRSTGLSFTTSLGEVAWTGEVVYRPNQPLQIDAVDLGFAAVQPMFPGTTLSYAAVDIPSRRTAAPDYVETVYRGNPEVQANQLIRGYERMKTLAYNTSFLFLKGASDNPFGADQLTALIEVGAFHVLDMPGLDQLQFAATGTQFHHSAGIDSTGTANADQQATGAQNRLNPSYQAGGFATAFSSGYRIVGQLTYEEVFPGVRVLPQAAFFHDVNGTSPLPSGEFVQGRKQAFAGVSVNYQNSWSGTLRYQWYFGGGVSNSLTDRDNIQLALTYDF